MGILTILFSLRGRIGRLGYWLGSLLRWVIVFAAAMLVVTWLSAVIAAAGPQVQVSQSDDLVARLQGYSATSSAIGEALARPGAVVILIACALTAIYVWSGVALAVKRWHDRNKTGWWTLIGFIPLIGPVWTFLECGCLPGTRGPNRFGASPYGVGDTSISGVETNYRTGGA